ncbi:uncharacterized protein FOMMEDRAFT_93491 [Fomitiporia mediterranea MF3/22]|uniref:uncharacterized protein n=1 Tax=Fomitiporia mediterranea (strain MF3/22) TaxID=694068 RepID=UPI0004408FCF|nr:uncharacterized protein FOMMEDRAFT_93491 [Fomitiporia mediterranea MF3/22]EJC99783.1 hypothetical protein FOMMEDRAFT_93491 [Fomitiporia mediterranea MF3/22]
MAANVGRDKAPEEPDKNAVLTDVEAWWRDYYELLESCGYKLQPHYQPGWILFWKGTGKNAFFFDDLSLPKYVFLIMPFLHTFNNPPFFSVDEVLDFVKQTLEGLVYMHGQNVAHRDCAAENIMLDATVLYPKGFHPVANLKDPLGRKHALVRRCRDVEGVKYYFIDFDISSRFEEDVKKDQRHVTSKDGQDCEVPELSRNVPYDPFVVNVFILRNVYRKTFLDVNRPTAEQALKQFYQVINAQSSFRLRWRLIEKDAGLVQRVFQDISSVTHEGLYISKAIISKLSNSILKHY